MKVVIHEDVFGDLTSIVNWYEKQSLHLGRKFLNEWESALKLIERNPYIFQIKYKGFRHVKLNRFPYLIIFEIEDSSVTV